MGKSQFFLLVVLYLVIYLLRVQQGGWEPQLDLFPEVRHKLDQQIGTLLPSPQAQLLSGILLGQNKSLPPEFRLALRDTSTLHIVVASGQNLTFVAGFFLYLAGLIKRRVVLTLTLVAVVSYVILTGGQIPILRAAVMVTLAFLAQLLGRQNSSIWVLTLTAAVFLLINPKWISDLSFQLSFLATLGVVVAAPIILKYLKFVPVLSSDLATSLGAQMMVTPVIIQNFHQLSLVSILANLLVLWTVSLIMISGSVMLALSLIWQPLGNFSNLPVNILLTYFVDVVKLLASLNFSWVYVGEKIWLVWAGYYLLVGGILLIINKFKVKS